MRKNVIVLSELPSGIFQSVNETVFVVFGGKVATSIESNGDMALVSFDQLKESHAVGESLDEHDNSVCENEGNFPINMLFHNEKEIDVVLSVLEEAKREICGDNIGMIKRTERGWVGHFCCAFECAFRRNTLLEYRGQMIVVSTVGRMYDGRGKLDTVGRNRYYETMAFFSEEEDIEYHDIDAMKKIQLDCEWAFNEIDDNKANEMHENAVRWVSEQMVKDNIKIVEV